MLVQLAWLEGSSRGSGLSMLELLVAQGTADTDEIPSRQWSEWAKVHPERGGEILSGKSTSRMEEREARHIIC